MFGPPGEPAARRTLPSGANTMVGAMLERGRFPGAISFGPPGVKSKSVSWLLRRKPRTMMRLPNVASIVVVIDATLPSASTIEMWLVPAASVSPGRARRIERSPMRPALFFK
jgi:hypothetical protein